MWKLRPGPESGPSPLQQEDGRDLIPLICNAARGRRPLCLITPCQGPRPGSALSRVLLGGFRHGHNRWLLHGLLADGLLGGILIGSCRLGCSQASNIAPVSIRGRTNKDKMMLTSNSIQDANIA